MRQIIDGKNFYTTPEGALMPEETIKPIDLLRDQTVEGIVNSAIFLRKDMQEKKQAIMNDIDAFLETASEKYEVKYGGKKGNLTLNAFDGLTRIVISKQEKIGLTEGVLAAEQLIKECLNDWTKDSGKEIKAIVNKAFRVKQGNLNVKGILGLRTLNIDDEKWLKAMDIISDSIQVLGSKEYLRIYQRETAADEFEQVTLDLTTL